jgi:hypothetical protein
MARARIAKVPVVMDPDLGIPDHWKIVDCAQCSRHMLGSSMRAEFKGKEAPSGWVFIGGHVAGRPYCFACLNVHAPTTAGSYGPLFDDDPSPWGENAVRELEDIEGDI